jgi:RNA polymerase sigma factor (sigma-70 family)
VSSPNETAGERHCYEKLLGFFPGRGAAQARHLSKTRWAGYCYRLDLEYFVGSKRWRLIRLKAPYSPAKRLSALAGVYRCRNTVMAGVDPWIRIAWLPMTAAAEPSDTELVERVIAGKPGAFDAFYRRYSRLIKASVWKRFSNTFASPYVDDVVADFFFRLVRDEYRVLQGWQRGSSLANFLFVVVRNHSSDYIRKHASPSKLRQDVDLAEWFDKGKLRGVGRLPAHLLDLSSETPAHALGVQQLRHAVALACQQVKQPRSRMLLRLKLLKQLPNDDIAQRMQMVEGAARTAISRAKSDLLTELRRLVPEYYPDVV